MNRPPLRHTFDSNGERRNLPIILGTSRSNEPGQTLHVPLDHLKTVLRNLDWFCFEILQPQLETAKFIFDGFVTCGPSSETTLAGKICFAGVDLLLPMAFICVRFVARSV